MKPACFPAPAEVPPPKAIRVLSARLMQSPRWLSSPSNQSYVNPIPRKQRHLRPAKGYCLMSGGHVGPILSQSASPQPHVSFEAGP